MTIEEKAKAYDKALKVANKYKDTHIMFPSIKDEMFPELKESEDERISKALIHLITEQDGYLTAVNGISTKDILAWLEKQGEQKIVEFKPSFKVGDVIKPKDPVLGEQRIIKGIYPKFGYDTNNGILDFEFEDNWELVEQKPAFEIKSAEESLGIDSETYNKIVDECIYGEQKPAETEKGTKGNEREIPFSGQEWSEEDNLQLQAAIDICKSSGHTITSDWLKSLKDRVQPKQEWSEEDEAKRNALIGLVDLMNIL